MDSTFIQMAMKELEKQKDRAMFTARHHYDHALLSFPDFAEIEKVLRQAVVDKNRLCLNGAEAGLLNDAMQTIKALQNKRDDILRQHGLSQKDFTPQYQCPQCQDTGFAADGYCTCLKQRIIEKSSSAAHIPPEHCFACFDEKLFSHTVKEGQKQSAYAYMKKALAFCENYAKELPKPLKPNIIFMGPTGTGKTFLLHAIARAACEKGISTLCTTAYQLQQACFIKEERAFALSVDVLLIDDLGAEPFMDNVTQEWFGSIISERLLQGRPTVLSTNLLWDPLFERYGERIGSRLQGPANVKLDFNFDDIRILLSKKQANISEGLGVG